MDAFKAKYPDVDLQITEGAFDAQQFLSAVASGRPPDLIHLDRDVLGSYAHRGALQPLTSCVDRAGLRTTDFRSTDGTVVGLDSGPAKEALSYAAGVYDAAGFFRTIIYLPVMTPPVTIGALFLLLLNGQTGPINGVLGFFGVTGPN